MAKRGRHKVIIDLELVERLANIQCTIDEISGVLKIPESTLRGHADFSLVYKNAVKNGKASLRRTQFKMSETSAAMAIWLGKQYLGQNEKFEVTNTELMREEIEIVTNKHKPNIKNRIAQFIQN